MPRLPSRSSYSPAPAHNFHSVPEHRQRTLVSVPLTRTMSPDDQDEHQDPDPLYWGYRERTRAVLRHLILERGVSPGHPLVASFEHHLSLTTAHREYTLALERCPYIDRLALQLVCYTGSDLRYKYQDMIATSVHDDNSP